MNNAEAKFILSGYRPSGADAADPAFGDALQQVQRDPALREWFGRQQIFDTAVSAKLAEVPVPAGLREAILAGGRVTESGISRSSWWRSPMLLAAAASFTVIIGLAAFLWPKVAVGETSFGRFALDDARHSEAHGGHGGSTDALQAALSNPATRLGANLPVNFGALGQAGCRTVTFQGREVLEVCFERNGVWFHCYIARRADFPALVADAKPVLTERDGASLAAWADAAHVFVVVSKTGRTALERLL